MTKTALATPDPDDDNNLDKHIAGLSPEDLAILKWHLKRRAKQIAPTPLPLIWFLLGGRGCVAAGTPIWDPVNKKSVPVEDRNAPGWVLAQTPDGPKPAMASASFIKGEAELFEVQTATGDVIRVTAEHQFLTQTGWKRLQEIGVGDQIAFDPSFPQELLSDAQHLKNTALDSQDDYHQLYHSCDQLLPQKSSTVQSETQQQVYALEHNQTKSCSDDQELSQECIPHRPQFDLLSKIRFDQDGPLAQDVLFPAQSFYDEQSLQRLLIQQQSLLLNGQQDQTQALLCALLETVSDDETLSCLDEFEYQQQLDVSSELRQAYQLSQTPLSKLNQTHTSVQLQDEVHSSFNSPILSSSYLYYTKIRSILSLGVGTFFDLTVPGYENYLASNVWNHNSGKTLTAASHVFEYCLNLPDTPKNREVRIALVGQTYDDVKKTMVEGETGLLGVIPKEYGPPQRFSGATGKWNRTIGELTINLPPSDKLKEGRTLIFASYTAQVPGKLRGPQFHLAWIDEPAKFVDADIDPDARDTTWNNLMMGLRLGPHPHVIVSGTPTPCKLVLFLLAHPNCTTSTQTTWENRENLPDSYVKELERLDPNSRTYRQEVMAEILLDTPDAIFNQENINANRGDPPEGATLYKVLGYDPAASNSVDSDEAGIVLVGYVPERKSRAKDNKNGGGRPIIEQGTEAYVLKDLSDHLAPSEQAELVIRTILEEKCGDLIFEQNQGVDFIVTLLSHALKDQTAEYTIRRHRKPKMTDFGSVKRFTVKAYLKDGTVHKFLISAIQAMKSKKVRAESASYQYDTKRVHHPKNLPVCPIDACKMSLEYQMTSWSPNKTSNRYMSPDRMDALVYALFHIFGRHALHSNANSRLSVPGHNRADTSQTSMTDQQKNPANAIKKHVSLYSVDMGTRSTIGDRIDLDSPWGRILN